jgi:hypothetical protein
MEAYIVILILFGSLFLIEVVSIVRFAVQHLEPKIRIRISFRINLAILITAILMLAVRVLFDVNYLQYKAPMPYSEWKSITFSDFRGLNRPGQTLDGMNEFAFIVPEMRVRRSSGTTLVETYFHPCRSYVYNHAIQDDKLLTHELYHLHITEYFARLLRKKLSGFTNPIPEDQFEVFVNETRGMERAWQFTYDDETYHSYLAGKQRGWEKKVDSCLTSLKSFANTRIANN